MKKRVVTFKSLNKAARAKLARETINQIIPVLLSSNARARLGVSSSELITNPAAINIPEDPIVPTHHPIIRISHTDTLTAAASLQIPASAAPSSTHPKGGKIGILNMASALRPGGGVLNGSKAQEEFLCLRTTLYPSLHEHYYRLPELGVVYTPDVLVFRDAECVDLPKHERYFVDVVSAAMIRSPDTTPEGKYAHSQDEEAVIQKMRAVMRVLMAKGIRRVVLGAWGCGAFRNPVGEVARLWKRVILGITERGKVRKVEPWNGLEEIVFAITDGEMVDVFEECFDGLLGEEGKLRMGQAASMAPENPHEGRD